MEWVTNQIFIPIIWYYQDSPVDLRLCTSPHNSYREVETFTDTPMPLQLPGRVTNNVAHPKWLAKDELPSVHGIFELPI